MNESGPFEARYLAFLETIVHLRPSLHRYCARMTGSVMDGEDVVQEALFQAYRKLETFDDNRPLAPWLFRIAHNRCIDFLRMREVREDAEAEVVVADSVEAIEPVGPALGRAVEHLVSNLPPKERACVLLKDVFDYSLEEIAELVDSTVGGVKAALVRGRSKLSTIEPSRAKAPAANVALVRLYVERFNSRDWDGVRELITADARLRVADRFDGRVAESPYFGNYERWSKQWKLTTSEIEGSAVAIVSVLDREKWTPHGFVRFEIADDRITRIVDYVHCTWIAAFAAPMN